MTEQCFRKCVAMYKEPELSVGEATCVDRCVARGDASDRVSAYRDMEEDGVLDARRHALQLEFVPVRRDLAGRLVTHYNNA